MSRVSSSSLGLPTATDIASWQESCAQIDKEIQTLTQRKTSLLALIEAGQAVLSGASNQSQPGARKTKARQKTERRAAAELSLKKPRGRPKGSGAKRGPTTWTSTLLDVVNRGGKMSYEDAKAEIAKTPLAAKMSKSDKGFYGAILKLETKEQIKRHKGWLFSITAYRKHMDAVSSGRMEDEEAPRNSGQQSPVGDGVKEALRSRVNGATSGEIVSALKTKPELALIMERNKTHVYNVLARLVDRGELVKGGGRYYLAPESRAA